MGKPRMIMLIRHAQSEGNKNRDIHQMIPDHRVKLTPEGWQQAQEAGLKLRDMLRPDDTIRVFTSPYRRTRETTQGILGALTASTPENGPSPFSRSSIKVYEEPRLREQDFGNFQPCSAEMERMWQERADYGHFFYRIPDGESAADAYDRISGFNESLWRNFSEDDFPSVCILVTHGLMTRVFLMKWYHWSVEYFEDLRNINHCEFITMKKNAENGKYDLENKLRTWSEMKRRATVTTTKSQVSSPIAPASQPQLQSPTIAPLRQWGGCVGGCNHDHSNYPRRIGKGTSKDKAPTILPPAAKTSQNENEDHPVASQAAIPTSTDNSAKGLQPPATTTLKSIARGMQLPLRPANLELRGRDAGGTLSGAATPQFESEGFGFSDSDDVAPRDRHEVESQDIATPLLQHRPKTKPPRRRPTEEDLENWARQSGMGTGARADALGDEPDEDEDEDHGEGESGFVGTETTEEQKRFGYQKEEILGPKDETVKEIEKLEAQDQSLRGSVY